MKGVLYTILLLMSSTYCKAQYYDSAKAVVFVNELLKKKNNSQKRIYYLVDKQPYLHDKHSETKDLYKDLAPYFTIEQIDSAITLSKVLAQHMVWSANTINIPVISEDSASTIIQSNSTLIVVLKKNTKRAKRKAVERAKKAKEEQPRQSIYYISAPIFFNNDYCIILVSQTYANTNGSSCIKLYKLSSDGAWKNIVNTSCKLY